MKYWTTETFEKKPFYRRHTLTLNMPLALISKVFNNTKTNIVIIDETWLLNEQPSKWEKNKIVKPYHRFAITFMWQHIQNYSFNLSSQYVKVNRTIYSTTGPLNSISLEQIKKWSEKKMLAYYELMVESLRSESIEITTHIEKIKFEQVNLPIVPPVPAILKPSNRMKNFWQKILKNIKRGNNHV